MFCITEAASGAQMGFGTASAPLVPKADSSVSQSPQREAGRRDGASDAEIAPEMEDTPALPPQATSEETRRHQTGELSIQMPANNLPTVTHQ